MAPRRAPPLFELLRESDSHPRHMAARPVVAPPVEPKPKPGTETRVRPVLTDPTAQQPTAQPLGEREFSIGMTHLLFGGAGAIALLLITWTIGYNLGRSHESAEWSSQLQPTEAAGTSGTVDLPLNPGLLTREEPDRVAFTPAVASGERAEPALRPATEGSGERRVAGNNYLKIATRVQRAEAEGAVEFLRANGVDALAVLDRGASGSNNAPRYDLFTLLGVPSDRYTAMKGERERHAARVRELGRIWMNEHGGTVNFAQPVWTKYNG